MAIRRISDLSSILFVSKGDTYSNLTIEEGIKRDVLGGAKSRREGGEETTQLKESKLEMSWIKDGDDIHTKYESRSIDYATLCSYITHNIQCEDYDFYGNKNLCGDVNITGDVNINGDNFNVYSKNINLSGDRVGISGDQVFVDGRETYIYGHDFINISVITDPAIVGLSGDNITLNGKKELNLIYDTKMTIYWKTPTGELKPALIFSHDDSSPVVWFETESGVGTESNPVFGTMQYARWK